MDLFLDFCLFLNVEKQSYSFASARGIDGCCLELQCYTFLILTVCVFVCKSVCVNWSLNDVRLIRVFLNKNHGQISGGFILARAILE